MAKFIKLLSHETPGLELNINIEHIVQFYEDKKSTTALVHIHILDGKVILVKSIAKDIEELVKL